MANSVKNKSKLIHLSLINNLPEIIKYNVEKSDDDKYQETTAKQIEILQDKLAKLQDSRNEIIFWYIFTVLFLIDCFVFEHISSSLGILGLLLMEVVALICAANKLGQENALKLLNWLKNIIENFALKKTTPPSKD